MKRGRGEIINSSDCVFSTGILYVWKKKIFHTQCLYTWHFLECNWMFAINLSPSVRSIVSSTLVSFPLSAWIVNHKQFRNVIWNIHWCDINQIELVHFTKYAIRIPLPALFVCLFVCFCKNAILFLRWGIQAQMEKVCKILSISI